MSEKQNNTQVLLPVLLPREHHPRERKHINKAHVQRKWWSKGSHRHMAHCTWLGNTSNPFTLPDKEVRRTYCVWWALYPGPPKGYWGSPSSEQLFFSLWRHLMYKEEAWFRAQSNGAHISATRWASYSPNSPFEAKNWINLQDGKWSQLKVNILMGVPVRPLGVRKTNRTYHMDYPVYSCYDRCDSDSPNFTGSRTHRP